MGRFLSVLLLSASFATSPALAVNIGQVSAYSSANKPLRMDVELIDLQGARLNDVLMRVADETDHERFGLQRPAWADGSFARVLNKDSSSFVARLNSTRPVSASNVDFVVELRAGSTVTWHKVSAALGSGSPMLALPAESKPIVEKVAPVPVPIATPISVPASEQEFVAEEPIVTNDVAAFDATSTDGS
ncbi:MAG: hypothetical protein Q8K94_05620, partial [Moraxellaceae bacterium]|nr:hypothetical protein [Moraxellaceae bacterium]